MPTSIMDVLKTYPRESLDSDTMCDPPAEMELIAERWDLEALPADLVNLWTSTGERRLHHDIGLGKSAITILSSTASAERTERELRFWGVDDARLKNTDIVFATIAELPEFLVFDTSVSEFNILLASMFDEREKWPVVGLTIADFLRRYRNAPTETAWQRPIV
ncbi:hypothetical protein [Rhodococcus qingshengii]|uniref:hypothetical protein n=1 Tax=Rhodococcus qingshengii TaxID=334542 RepID=UPI00237D289B|nr:hypothetical protein [Rhodococcus qingshengii]WCT05979.1 hypothetical protein PI247_29610 [Rhodococcus qingshengii]